MVFGIDGMDYDFVRDNKSSLPFLNSLLENNGCPHLRSVFPADTTPAWSTIYLGVDPSEHGVINFINLDDQNSDDYKGLTYEDDVFKGKTFWDVLKAKGYKSVVLFPMNIKQGWDVNGLMITRPHNKKMNVWPAEKYSFYKPKAKIFLEELEYTSDKKLKKVKNMFYAKFDEEYRITKLALQNEDCDLFFSYFSTTDGVQHAFWRNCDPNHPEYPGDNPFKNVILEMYQKVDRMLSEFSSIFPNTPMMVVSDHGHGARPVWCARINEILRREGYLFPKEDNTKKSKKKTKNLIKDFGLKFVKKHGLPKFLKNILKKIPLWKKMFVSSSDFNWDKTIAYLSDLSAMKNYSYGGIRIVDKNVIDKEKVCDEIVEKLKKYEIDGENKPAFLWIRKTNTLYHGVYLNKYPEIIFQLDERFGASWDFGDVLFEKKGFMHQFSPGAHRYETAFLGTRDFKLNKSQYEMTDICNLIISGVTK